MASEVDICNLALAHLGDTATVTSLDPPEGSAQAALCARFYPIARDALMEHHTWGFATKRIALAQLPSVTSEWDYAYAQPSDALNIIAVLPPASVDDYSTGATSAVAGGQYVPQEYSVEVLMDGTDVILTDQADAMLRYTSVISDTSKFSPLFVVCLTWKLAAFLAGPIIKGDAGAAEAKRCEAMMQQYLLRAVGSDASQRRINPNHIVPWMSNR